jgi:hypothetical protein
VDAAVGVLANLFKHMTYERINPSARMRPAFAVCFQRQGWYTSVMRILNSVGIRTEHRGSFQCTGTDGNGYIVERVVNLDPHSRHGQNTLLEGETVYRCNGHVVGRIAKGRYRTWTGVDLKAHNPKAP